MKIAIKRLKYSMKVLYLIFMKNNYNNNNDLKSSLIISFLIFSVEMK